MSPPPQPVDRTGPMLSTCRRAMLCDHLSDACGSQISCNGSVPYCRMQCMGLLDSLCRGQACYRACACGSSNTPVMRLHRTSVASAYIFKLQLAAGHLLSSTSNAQCRLPLPTDAMYLVLGCVLPWRLVPQIPRTPPSGVSTIVTQFLQF